MRSNDHSKQPRLRHRAAVAAAVLLLSGASLSAFAAGAFGQTVEDLLQRDAQAAQAKAAAAVLAAAAPSNGAGIKPQVATVAAPSPDVQRNAMAAVPATPALPEIRVQSIYGLSSPGSDRRVVEVSVEGKARTMRVGDVFEGHALQSIEGACAVFLPMAKRVSVIATPQKHAHATAAAAAKPAEGPKARRACLDEASFSTASDNTLMVPAGRPMPMPSPVYRPTPPGSAMGMVSGPR